MTWYRLSMIMHKGIFSMTTHSGMLENKNGLDVETTWPDWARFWGRCLGLLHQRGPRDISLLVMINKFYSLSRSIKLNMGGVLGGGGILKWHQYLTLIAFNLSIFSFSNKHRSWRKTIPSTLKVIFLILFSISNLHYSRAYAWRTYQGEASDFWVFSRAGLKSCL